MLKVLMRVDGNSFIGMGHIMRCITLAKAFRKKGHTITFISKYIEGIAQIKDADFNVIPLDATSKNLIEECTRLKNVVKGSEVLIVDSYDVSEDYLLCLKKSVNLLCYIDDLNAFDYPVDVVINGNINSRSLGYKSFFKHQVFLLGPEYNLIRDEFTSMEQKEHKLIVDNILVTTGGSNPYSFMEWLIETIRDDGFFQSICLNVIIGNYFNNKDNVRKSLLKYNNIILHENVKKMSELMMSCDIATSSCGSTIYELCSCGVPTLGFIIAENQVGLAHKMHELGYINCLGWYKNISQLDLQSALKNVIEDYDYRKKVSLRQQLLLDGSGARNVVETIENLLNH